MRISEFKPVVEPDEKSVFVLIGDGRDDIKAFKGLVEKLTLAKELSCKVRLLVATRSYPRNNDLRTLSEWKGNSVFRAINVLASEKYRLKKFLVFYDLEHFSSLDKISKELENSGCKVTDIKKLGNYAYQISCKFAGKDVVIFFSILGKEGENDYKCLEDNMLDLPRVVDYLNLKMDKNSLTLQQIKRKLRKQGYEKLILQSSAVDVKQAFKSLYIVLREIDKSFNEHRAP